LSSFGIRQIQRQEPFENRVVGEIGGPAVGGGNGGVKTGVADVCSFQC